VADDDDDDDGEELIAPPHRLADARSEDVRPEDVRPEDVRPEDVRREAPPTIKNHAVPTELSEELLCGLGQWIELETCGMLDKRKFRDRLIPTVCHLEMRPGDRHRFARHHNNNIVPRRENPVWMGMRSVTQVTDTLLTIKKKDSIHLLARDRVTIYTATLMHVLDVMCNRHTSFSWKANIVLFERDFFNYYQCVLGTCLTPVICQHANCFSVLFRGRFHHCRSLVEAIALSTLIIVHALECSFSVGLQKFDLFFMREWLVRWHRMGRIYLAQNPFGQTKFDPAFEPLLMAPPHLRSWFSKHWAEMENSETHDELMADMAPDFEPVDLMVNAEVVPDDSAGRKKLMS
jgi:hypothetical protein